MAFVVFHWSFGSTTSNSKKQQTRSRFKPLNLRNRDKLSVFFNPKSSVSFIQFGQEGFPSENFFFCLNGYVEVFAAGGKGKADSGKCGGGEKSAPRES